MLVRDGKQVAASSEAVTRALRERRWLTRVALCGWPLLGTLLLLMTTWTSTWYDDPVLLGTMLLTLFLLLCFSRPPLLYLAEWAHHNGALFVLLGGLLTKRPVSERKTRDFIELAERDGATMTEALCAWRRHTIKTFCA